MYCGAALADLLPVATLCKCDCGAALADLPPVAAMPRFPGANEPCRKHAFAITLGYLTT